MSNEYLKDGIDPLQDLRRALHGCEKESMTFEMPKAQMRAHVTIYPSIVRKTLAYFSLPLCLEAYVLASKHHPHDHLRLPEGYIKFDDLRPQEEKDADPIWQKYNQLPRLTIVTP